MIDLTFDYRGETIRMAALSERDDIPTRIKKYGTFYEFDVLERCELYLRSTGRSRGVIIDVGAFIGNHTVFFATFCPADEVIAFEASKTSFEVLTQTIARNNLENVRLYNLALGETDRWGSIAVRDADNLGANCVHEARADQPGAIRIAPLDAVLEPNDKKISLMKIDVEGMECEVIRGAAQTIARWRPVLCVEMLDGPHMKAALQALRKTSYLIRECNGAAPTYLLAWESRLPRFVTKLLNFGWTLLAYFGNNAWRWRYRRVIEIALPL